MRSTSDRVRSVQRLLADRPAIVLTGILILLILITNFDSPGFATPHHLAFTLLTAASLGVLSAGQTVVAITAGIDLSVAATATAAAYTMAYYGTQGTAKSVGLALVVGLVVGLVNGIGVGFFRVQPLIMTLGVSGIISGLLTLRDTTSKTGTPLITSQVHELGSGMWLSYIPWNVLIIWAPLSILLIYVLPRSGLGRVIYAVGDNPLACRLSGIRVWQVLLATYVLCGLCSALAGILYAGYSDAADLSLVTPFLLPSVAAVVIGGTSIFGGNGGYSGTVLGALILTVLDSLLTLHNASQALKQMFYGAIVLALAWIYIRASGGE